MSELEPFEQKCSKALEPSTDQKPAKNRTKAEKAQKGANGSNSIVFSRRRMLYSRSGGDDKGLMRSGLGATRMLFPLFR